MCSAAQEGYHNAESVDDSQKTCLLLDWLSMIHKPLLLLAVIFLLAPLKFSREQQKVEDEPVKLGTELVVVDAQVLSKKTGRVVGGLTREDFALYEDGVKQYISHFSQDKLPLSILLLLDVSGSVEPVIEQVRDNGMAALGLLKPEDEVAVMAFGLWAKVMQDFTRDRKAVIQSIKFIDLMGPWIRRATYINESVYQAAVYMRKASNPDSRRVIIIITDNLTNQPDQEGHSRSDASEQLVEAGIVMSSLVVTDFDARASSYMKRGMTLYDSVGPFVSETGGLYMQTDKTGASAKLAELIERLRTRYSFGYTPSNPGRDGKFRKIKLQISHEIEKREGRIAVVARKGYYAPRRNNPAQRKEPLPR